MQQEQQQMVGQSVVVNHTQPTPGIPQEERIINMTASASPVDGGILTGKFFNLVLEKAETKIQALKALVPKALEARILLALEVPKVKGIMRNHLETRNLRDLPRESPEGIKKTLISLTLQTTILLTESLTLAMILEMMKKKQMPTFCSMKEQVSFLTQQKIH